MSLYSALAARFTDADEIKDVARYGCSGGVSGFIYSTELAEFFDKYEDEIEDVMDDYGVTYQYLVPEAETMQQYKEAAVWFIVESYCQLLETDELIAA